MDSKVEKKNNRIYKIQEKQGFTKEFFYSFNYLLSIYSVTVSVLGTWDTSVDIKMDKNFYYYEDYFLL